MIYIVVTLMTLFLSYMLSTRKIVDGFCYLSFPSYKKTVIAFMPYILLMAFRWNLGHDTNYYTGHYSVGYKAAAQGLNKLDYSIGFFKYFQFLSSRNVPIFFAYFIISIIYMLAVCIFIKRIRINSIYAVLTFFGVDMFLFAFAAVRQTLSMAFLLVCLAYYFKPVANKKKNSVIVCTNLLIALLLHYTTFVYVFMMIGTNIYNRFMKLSKNGYLCIMIGLLIGTPVIYTILHQIMERTVFANLNKYELEIREFYILFFIILFIACYLYYERINRINKKYFMLTIVSMILLEVYFCSGTIYNPDRIFQLFTPIYLILIPTLFGCMKRKKNRLFFLLVFVILFVLNLRGYYTPGCESYEKFQYHSVFEQFEFVMSLHGR